MNSAPRCRSCRGEQPVVGRPVTVSRSLAALAVITYATLVGGVLLRHLEAPGGYFFYADQEDNFWTWLSTGLLLLLAGVLALCAAVHRAEGRPWMPWALLSGVAAYLSLDEDVMLHERLAGLMGSTVDSSGVRTHPFLWIGPGIALAVVVGGVLLWLARALPRHIRLRLVASGAVFLSGAIGVEVLSAVLSGDAPDEGSVVYQLLVLLEEGLEVSGVLMAIATGLAALCLHAPPGGGVVLRLRDASPDATARPEETLRSGAA